MLSGKELGDAIRAAMRLKKVNQIQVAEEFDVLQPSVSSWVRTGRVHKDHIGHLINYFADVVGPEHWGLPPMQADAALPWPAGAAGAPAPSPGVADAIGVLSTALMRVPASSRQLAVELCATLARAPDSAAVRQDLTSLLAEARPSPTWRDCAIELISTSVKQGKQLPPANEIIQLVDALYAARTSDSPAPVARTAVKVP